MTFLIRLGVTCEHGSGCGLVQPKNEAGDERACRGEHLIEDYQEGQTYTTVLEVPEFRKGLYQ